MAMVSALSENSYSLKLNAEFGNFVEPFAFFFYRKIFKTAFWSLEDIHYC